VDDGWTINTGEKVGPNEEKTWEKPLNKGEAQSLYQIEAAITQPGLSGLVGLIGRDI
jgi:hypothetical protein